MGLKINAGVPLCWGCVSGVVVGVANELSIIEMASSDWLVA